MSSCRRRQYSRIAEMKTRLTALLCAVVGLSWFGLAQDTLPAGPMSQDQVREIIRRVADHEIANTKKQRDYTYTRRQVLHHLNDNGQVQSTEVKTYEVTMLYGSPVDRLVAKDDKPLSPKDLAKEDARIQKIIDKRKNETDEQREKRLRQEQKDAEESRQWIREISDAFTFNMVRIDVVGGRPAYVVDANPRPGYKPRLKNARFLPKFRFRLWVDQADMQVVKLNAECIDTITFGVFLAKLRKGAHIAIEQTRINDEVWLPKHEAFNLSANIALLKNFYFDIDNSYSDYKKFRTDSRIVGVVSAADQR
jgi:hypothetical protein